MAKKTKTKVYLCSGTFFLKQDGDYSFRTEVITLKEMREKVNNKKIELIPLLKTDEIGTFNKALRKRFSAIDTAEGEEEKITIDLEPGEHNLSINIKDLQKIYESIKHDISEDELLKMPVKYRFLTRTKDKENKK